MAKKDVNQLAKYIVDIATGETPNPITHKRSKAGSQQKGGRIGGKSRAEKLTPEQRKEIASKAAKKRWKG